MRWTAAILAGGQSSRMGQDKALLTLGGETLLARTIRLCHEAGAECVLVIGREKPPEWTGNTTLFLLDPPERSGSGPLGGLATALENAPTEAVLLLACDMPALRVITIQWLIQSAEQMPPHGLITEGPDGEWEPLFSLYTRQTLPCLLDRLASGKRSMKGFIQALPFSHIMLPAEHGEDLQNLNTPEEWAAYLQQHTRSIQ